jgi:hypothetical protein
MTFRIAWAMQRFRSTSTAGNERQRNTKLQGQPAHGRQPHLEIALGHLGQAQRTQRVCAGARWRQLQHFLQAEAVKNAWRDRAARQECNKAQEGLPDSGHPPAWSQQAA